MIWLIWMNIALCAILLLMEFFLFSKGVFTVASIFNIIGMVTYTILLILAKRGGG